MLNNNNYDLKDIVFMVKDARDPYVIAYKIGKNGNFYNIKSKTIFAKFL